jgi:predicted nuclease with TOPRIM domain
MLASLQVAPVYVALLAAAAGAAGPRLVEWLARRVRSRGTVGASESSEIWQECRDLRDALRLQIEDLQTLVTSLEEENKRLTGLVGELQQRVSELERATPLKVIAPLRARRQAG